MSRAALSYTDRSPARRFDGVDVTTPVAGYYRARLVSGGVRGGVRLFYGPPKDPVTGECSLISTAYAVEAVPAFLVHPDDSKTAETKTIRTTDAR